MFVYQCCRGTRSAFGPEFPVQQYARTPECPGRSAAWATAAAGWSAGGNPGGSRLEAILELPVPRCPEGHREADGGHRSRNVLGQPQHQQLRDAQFYPVAPSDRHRERPVQCKAKGRDPDRRLFPPEADPTG